MTQSSGLDRSRAASTCARCGAAFFCGVGDAAPCPCSRITLDEATRAALRASYSGCLCLDCLAVFSAPAPPVATPQRGG